MHVEANVGMAHPLARALLDLDPSEINTKSLYTMTQLYKLALKDWSRISVQPGTTFGKDSKHGFSNEACNCLLSAPADMDARHVV